MPAPPVVFHVIPTLLTGGAEGMLESLLSANRDEGYTQVVVNLTGEGAFSRTIPGNVELHELGLAGIAGVPIAVHRLAKLIRKRRPVAVQSWLHYADLISLAATELSGRRATTRLYWGVRSSNLDLTQYGVSLRWTVNACAKFSHRPNAVVANSFVGRAAHLAWGYKPQAFPVIHNGIDLERFRPNPIERARRRAELGIGAEQLVGIHVARLDPMKDHRSLLAAAENLPDITFLLVGRGTETLPLPRNAIALGNRRDVCDLYSAADFGISTSAFGEGFPNATAEAMACGLPVIATNVGDAPLIVGACGYVISPGNRTALIAGIRSLASSSAAERHSLGANARTRIEAHFSLQRAVCNFDRLLLHGKLPPTIDTEEQRSTTI